MKYLLILSCLLFWFRPQPLETISAEQKESVGGRPESGVFVSYTFKMIANYDSEKLNVSELWIDSAYFQVSPYKQNADLSFSKSWEKGDTIFLKAGYRYYPDEKYKPKDNNGPHKALPKAYEGAALIAYKFKGKTKYHIVKQIKKLPKNFMP
jgi:hypothetical protein